jgi:hypothetical protein
VRCPGGDFPDRALMLESAEHNLRETLAFVADQERRP